MCEWRRSGGSRRIERSSAHVREEKKGNDVCRETQSPMKEGAVTCQERKKQEVLKKNRKRDEIYNTTGYYKKTKVSEKSMVINPNKISIDFKDMQRKAGRRYRLPGTAAFPIMELSIQRIVRYKRKWTPI